MSLSPQMSPLSAVSGIQPSFVDEVPAEIWEEIFRNILRDLPKGNNYTHRKVSRRIITSASQICSRIRWIAIETPYLWASILINFDSSTPSNNLMMTKLWLQRSQHVPLSISLFHIPGEHEATRESRECLIVILSEVARWKDAFLSAKSRNLDICTHAQGFIVDHAPLLESVILEAAVNDTLKERGTAPKKLWTTAPRFRKFVVISDTTGDDNRPNRRRFPSRTLCWDIPFQQLTHLRLDAYPNEVNQRAHIVFHSLANAPNLIACFISGITFAMAPLGMLATGPIHFQYLRHLYLETAYGGNHACGISTALLDHITAPSLITLTLANDLGWEIQYLERFVMRSACSLQELNIIGIDHTPDDTLSCLELSPSLRAVHFHSFVISDALLESWTAWNSSKGGYQLCPLLERLSIAGEAFSFSSDPILEPGMPLLKEALTARIHPPSGGPKRFTLLISAVCIESMTPELIALTKAGSNLAIAFNDNAIKRNALWDLYADR